MTKRQIIRRQGAGGRVGMERIGRKTATRKPAPFFPPYIGLLLQEINEPLTSDSQIVSGRSSVLILAFLMIRSWVRCRGSNQRKPIAKYLARWTLATLRIRIRCHRVQMLPSKHWCAHTLLIKGLHQWKCQSCYPAGLCLQYKIHTGFYRVFFNTPIS